MFELPGLEIFPACNETERECAVTQLNEGLGKLLRSETYFGSCNILEYTGKAEFDIKTYADNSTVIQYSFKQPETQTFQKEYLVYDTTTFIKENPIHIPKVPPTDPIKVVVSYTRYSFWNV